MFQRYISIDWSGAATDDERVDLRVVQASADGEPRIVHPPDARPRVRSWKRSECLAWIRGALRSNQPRCLVAMDFGFGLPWGADQAVYGCQGWQAMLAEVTRLYQQHETARATALAVNGQQRFGGQGPYRFNESRTNFRFYLDQGVGYYRAVELTIPQAISQWYLGSGGTVGFHTITGMAFLTRLMTLRQQGEIDFQIWPQEGETPDYKRHLLVESYPAVCPALEDYGPCEDDDQRDAWKVLRRMLQAVADHSLEGMFQIPSQSFGRIDGVDFLEQVRFEGWIFGVV